MPDTIHREVNFEKTSRVNAYNDYYAKDEKKS